MGLKAGKKGKLKKPGSEKGIQMSTYREREDLSPILAHVAKGDREKSTQKKL